MRTQVVIGSRGSLLALTQTNHIADMLKAAQPGLEVRVEVISTRGDRIQNKPLSEIGGKGLFTEELEAALREGLIDLAVHSLKDLPTDDPEGLAVGATPKRVTPNDALVCSKWTSLDELPDDATVGTSSLRRKAQLLAAKPGLTIVDLRGNIDTRMKRVADGDIDAAILACAGIERLGRNEAIAEVLSTEIMIPACGQGALGIQCRAEDPDVRALLGKIHHADSAAETTAERAFLSHLGGGCQVPIGAIAVVSNGRLRMRGCVCSLDGAHIIRVEIEGDAEEAEILGRDAALLAVEDGADTIIASI